MILFSGPVIWRIQ